MRPFGRGDSIDRFTVLAPLGEGGMGVVVSAYDCTLDRKVAIKVLRPDRLALKPEEGRSRLLREAQAMARLNHPNVITVYEVGRIGDQVFVAMELVEGETLASWMRHEPRTWRDVVRTFVRAGHGLVAAHQAGLAHRDFKPENVLVGREGEVRVTDFGLASLSDGLPTGEEMLLGARLTRTGTILGTPAYMSPEQHRGEEADARSDQFSFCVALYEALYGVPPFAGKTSSEVLEAILARRLCPPRREAPRWLRPLIVRGLQSRPEDRWPSLEPLLEKLVRDPGAVRRRRLLWSGAAVLMAAVVAVLSTRDRAVLCDGAAARVASIWEPAARQRVRAAFLATGSPIAADTFERVDRALRGRLAGWAAAHIQACRATHVTGEQPEAVLDLRMQCLERARRQIASLVDLWQEEQVNLNQAVEGAVTAGDVDACADTEALASPVPPPRNADSARRVGEVRVRLDEVVAHHDGGQLVSGLALAREAVGEAKRLGYAPLLAEALYWNGVLEGEAGKLEIGMSLLYAAAKVGAEAHDDVLVAKILQRLLYLLSTRARRYAEATTVWGFADAAVARAGNREDLVANLLVTQGLLLHEQGRSGEAVPLLERALVMFQKLHGPEHPDVAWALHNLGLAMKGLGRFDESIAFYRRALTIQEHAFGADNARVATTLNNLANALEYMGDYDGAGPHAERSLAIREKIYPPDHPNIANGLHTLGILRSVQGRWDEARVLYERAERIWVKALGASHPSATYTRDSLAALAAGRGDLPTARTLAESVLDARIHSYGPEHPRVAHSWITLGDVLRRSGSWKQAEAAFSRATAILGKQTNDRLELGDALRGMGQLRVQEGRYADAISLLQEAKTIIETIRGPENPVLAEALVPLGDAYLATGRKAEAVATLDRAVTIGEKKAPAHPRLALARFHLARALWASGERARALALARAARDQLAQMPLPLDVAEVERWLRRRGAGYPDAR